VLGGVITNAKRTSINLASLINDRKIDRLLSKTAIDAANIVTQNAMAYLQDRMKTNTQEKVTYLNNNNSTTPIKTQTTKPLKISDYLKVSALQLISNLVKNAGNIFYKDLPYLFKAKKNTMYFADLYVTSKYKGLPNIDTNNKNDLIIKNPVEGKITPSSITLNSNTIKKVKVK
jgi:hypothetical protein